MIHKGWRMFSQNVRSIAHTPGLFKTLSIIRIYSKHWANIQIYSNVCFVMKTNTNIYSSTKIFEYSNIWIFVLIPVLYYTMIIKYSPWAYEPILSAMLCSTKTFSLNRPHWADSVIESPCPSVVLCHRAQFFSRPVIGPEVTWSVPGLSLVLPTPTGPI